MNGKHVFLSIVSKLSPCADCLFILIIYLYEHFVRFCKILLIFLVYICVGEPHVSGMLVWLPGIKYV